MQKRSKKGLVLSGGGARGAYQMGCWRAFRELNIDFDIVSGTSIGALNASLYCEGNYNKSIEFWRNLYSIDLIHIYNALETIIEKAEINEEAIRQSGKELIITTLEEDTLKPAYHKLSETPRGHLRKIIRASMTCWSGFGTVDISRKEHKDAGDEKFGDNTPIKPIYKNGVMEIFVVYLESEKLTNKERFPNAIIRDIAPEKNLGPLWKFNDKITIERIETGYNDSINLITKREKRSKEMGFSKKHELVRFRKEVTLEEDEEIHFSLWGKLKSPDDPGGRSGVLSVLTSQYLRFFRHGVIRDSINMKIPFNCIKQFSQTPRAFNFILDEILPGHFEYTIDKEEPKFRIDDFYKELQKFL